MPNPPQIPLGGLDPADLLRQGVAEDTFMDAAPSAFNPPPLEELTPLFPQFEILELIGKGGMGAVYKVRQKDLDRIVALKILPPGIGRSPEFSNRFTREARALAKLNHPGIVTLHEFGQQDGLYFILMEFVDGVNLAQLMKTGRVSPREALAIVPQICDALQYAHDQGIVHRDIKPENILLDRSGRVKVADFGIAKVVASVCDRRADEDDSQRRSQTDATLHGKIIGTPQHMAPEQLEHPSDVDHRADIYALGVVFYQMLTGELPGKELQAPSRKVHIDVRLDEIVLKAMEKNPELRYQQASVMRTRVDGLRAAAHARPVSQSGGRNSASRRWWWLYLVMFPVGLVIGLGAGSLWAYIVPKKYEAQAVIELRPAQDSQMTPAFFGSQFESIKSKKSLMAVAEELELPNKWMVDQDSAVQTLRSIIQIENIRGTDLISVTVRHTNKRDAVEIVKAVARAYQQGFPGRVVVHEEPSEPRTPVSPNVQLVLVLGGLLGLVFSPLLALILILILQRLFPGPGPAASPAGAEVDQPNEPAHGASGDDRVDPFAITSLVLGICSLILGPLGAVPAIVFGHLSRGRIRKNPAMKGDGLAIAGLSLGYLLLAAFIMVIMIAVLRFQHFSDAKNTAFQRADDARTRAVAEAAMSESHIPRIQTGDTIHVPKAGDGDPGSKDDQKIGILVDQWLAVIDGGNYVQSWNEAAVFFQQSITAEAWNEAMTKFRKPLGEVRSRKTSDMKVANTLPGAPDGKYWIIQCDTSFAAKAEAVETVTFILEKDGSWKAAGYFIR